MKTSNEEILAMAGVMSRMCDKNCERAANMLTTLAAERANDSDDLTCAYLAGSYDRKVERAEGDAVVSRKAFKALFDYADSQECRHEATHRGGAIWTVCDDCGEQWADDRGGFKEYVDPPAIASARTLLATSPPETSTTTNPPQIASKVVGEQAVPCSLSEALNVIEEWGMQGWTLDGDDAPRFRALADKIAPVHDGWIPTHPGEDSVETPEPPEQAGGVKDGWFNDIISECRKGMTKLSKSSYKEGYDDAMNDVADRLEAITAESIARHLKVPPSEYPVAYEQAGGVVSKIDLVDVVWKALDKVSCPGIYMQIAAEAVHAVAPMMRAVPDGAFRKLHLWFFRDLSNAQRLALFSLYGFPVEEIGEIHAHQTRALRHLLAATPTPSAGTGEG